MASVTRQDLIDFVVREAQLLDAKRFDEWNALFTDDAIYWMPIVEQFDEAANRYLMRTELHYTETQGDEMVMLVGTAYHHLSQIDGSLRITHKRVNLINCDAALPAVQLFI